MNTSFKTKYITKVAILSALSFLIMLLEFPLPLLPTFLKIDLSEIPVLLGTFALGPVAGIIIELVKNLIHLTITSTAGIGELANFLVGITYVIPAGLIYKYVKNKKGAFIALVFGTVSMTIFASLLNYYVFIPLYGIVLKFPADAIIGMGTQVNKNIVSLKTFITLAIAPFNIVKGVVVSILVLLMYKRLSPLLHNKV